jgi:hypothetical protein
MKNARNQWLGEKFTTWNFNLFWQFIQICVRPKTKKAVNTAYPG